MEDEEQGACVAMDELERLTTGSKPFTGIFQQGGGWGAVVSRTALCVVNR